jgi:hypothetical protein
LTAGRAALRGEPVSFKARGRNTGVNQHGDPVISFISSSFVERRDQGRAPV